MEHRHYADSGWYHLYNRGARRRPIFVDRHDRSDFLGNLADAASHAATDVHAYCLMGNHYHLLVFAEGECVSSFAQRLASTYVKGFNKRHGLDGPMFRSRFGSTAVDTEAQLVETLRYIHNNPFNIGRDPTTFEWSSHRAYLGRAACPAWLTTNVMLSYFGGRVGVYDAFVRSNAGPPNRAITSEEFARRVVDLA